MPDSRCAPGGIALSNGIQTARYGSLGLRRELCARNIRWAIEHGLLFEHTVGALPSVLYRADEHGRHGNFFPPSYRRILIDPGWRRRLAKTHTTAQRHLLSHDTGRCELDSCNSSDALLMNIFCHPRSSSPNSALRSFLSIGRDVRFVFGHRPRVPMTNDRVDCTEVDLRAGDLLIEAKLTESDFQTARWELPQRYRDFDVVFNSDLLPGDADRVHGYQLVRGILAAFADETSRYCLLCDERRRDLIDLWFKVLSAVRRYDQRWRCILVTWQELSETLPMPLRTWLQQKYGIASSTLEPESDSIGRSIELENLIRY